MPKKHINDAKFLAVDFFCGAGGTTRGLIDAHGYVIAGIDKENNCRETYTHNNKNLFLDTAFPAFLNLDIFPETESHPSGQQAQLFEELDHLVTKYRQILPNTPLLFAICAPCQPFTKLSHDFSDKRKAVRQRDRNLLLETLKFIDKYEPEFIISENVEGIKKKKYGGVWEEFERSLMKRGYAVGSNVVCTSKFGIPQYRKRSILLAGKKEKIDTTFFSNLIENELAVPDENPDVDVVTVKDALKHFPALSAGETHPSIPNHKTRNLSDLNVKRISCAEPGVSNEYLENTKYGDLSLPCHRKVNARFKNRCFTDVYTRMHPNRPSPTMTTKCHSISNGRFGHFDTKQNRGISLREAACLQSFPDDYVFYPTDKVGIVAQMIGNAVPPRLSEYFASYLVTSMTIGN